MTPEQQQIAIAEACGWEKANHLGLGWWRHPVEKTACTTDDLPDYVNDLNAMHEAEKVIEVIMHERGDDYAYGDKLVEVTQDVRPIRATAAQRAEAFLKTLNFWKP